MTTPPHPLHAAAGRRGPAEPVADAPGVTIARKLAHELEEASADTDAAAGLISRICTAMKQAAEAAAAKSGTVCSGDVHVWADELRFILNAMGDGADNRRSYGRDLLEAAGLEGGEA